MSNNVSLSSRRLSVLVPVYNTGALLEPCLRSLSAQDFESIEFVCIDDGSTDGSADVLDAWAARDSRFRVLHLPNGGYGKAMNRALDEARGEWIGIVEPDDTIEPTMYSHLMELAAHTRAPIVKGSYTIVRGGTTLPANKFASVEPGTELPAATVADYILGSPSIWSGIYRRSFLLENRIRFSETPGAAYQDLGFGIRTWIKSVLPPLIVGITKVLSVSLL
ncbi:MAG: glycosyltransferase [Akkermansia sp.]